MIGRTLKQYKIVEKLGSGGMGEVYVAEDSRLHRRVALKVLPAEFAGDAERARRFEREAQAVAALNHPHIVTLHSVEEADGVHFLTMELVEGDTLTASIPAGGLPLNRFFQWAIPLADAVAAAHQKGVIHRDLKPANVMVTPDGRPKVLDFGLAKLAEPAGGGGDATQLPTTSVTQDGRIVGTFAYMSPEQAEGRAVDARSDVFSLGILLYEMATGVRPFTGQTSLAVLSSILKEAPLPVSEVNPRLPQALARVIQRCLAKDPAGRFQSAQGLKAELAALWRESQSGDLGEPMVKAAAPRDGGRRNLIIGGGIAVVVLAVLGGLWLSRQGVETTALAPGGAGPGESAAAAVSKAAGKRRIAVLPMENLGPAQDAYFAAGISDEITSRLAAVSGLAVISRASTQNYDREGKSMQEIGGDLGVDYVLDGTVRWQRSAGGVSRVRVTPQLIEVATDTQLWSDRLDRSMEDLFAVQSEIASQVVRQLDVTLLSGERDAVEARPTRNLEAYREFLQAKELIHGMTESLWPEAIERFQRAVELDPKFALAWAGLSSAHSQMRHYRLDISEDRLARARSAADRALALDPDLPEAHLALGYYYYWGRRDYEQALEQLAAVQRPDDPEVLTAIAYIWRRQGRFEDTLAHLKNAAELSPRDPVLLFDIGETYNLLGRYAEADRWFARGTDLAPDQAEIYSIRTLNMVAWKGVAAARALWNRIPAHEDSQIDLVGIMLSRLERNYQAALDQLAASPAEVFQDQGYYWPRLLLEGQLLALMGRSSEARAACERAVRLLETKVRESDAAPRYRAGLALAQACAGRSEAAVREATLAADLYPVSRDHMLGPDFVLNQALVLAMAGNRSAALDLLESLASGPVTQPWGWLSVDPLWEPLWNEPRFLALQAKAAAG